MFDGKTHYSKIINKSLRRKRNECPISLYRPDWVAPGGKYGFIFDSTLNDFVVGELEHAILSCIKDTDPDIVLLEGQSALRNPTGPCGSEMLVSGNAKHVILVHAPKRGLL